MKVAFLKYPAYHKTRANNFEGKSNIGAHVIIDILKREGEECDIVGIEEVNKYEVILVSFTSVWDTISFCRHVYKNKDWMERKFTVVAGGFGMQNHVNLINFIDYAYYGRVEDKFIDMLRTLKSPYLFRSDHTGDILINKGYKLYPYEVDINGFKWKEVLVGCPYKCNFCSYSFTRNYLTTKSRHEFNFYNKSNSVEIDFWNYKNYNNQANVSMALDGWSERLRYEMNKKISNGLIKKALVYISNNSTCKAVRIKLYNIEGYDDETDNDMFEFIHVMFDIIPLLKTKLFIVIHTTPLFPSRFTNVENHPIRFNLNLHKRKSFCKYIKTDKLVIEDDNYNSSDLVNLEGIISIYGTREQFNILISDSTYKKLNVIDKLKYLNYGPTI